MSLHLTLPSKLSSPIPPTITITVRKKHHFIDLMMAHIESKYDDVNFCVVKLATLLKMTASQLTRRVFELTGNTPAKLILHHRLCKACYLLLNSNEPLKNIAQITGFRAQASFCRSFTNAFGISPSKYRETQNAEHDLITYWKIPIDMSDAKILLNHAAQHQWLKKLLSFSLSECFNHKESIPKLAKLLNTTPSTLNRKLKELYPITSARFIRDLRLQYASELLGNADTITEVAVATGFFDHSHFCRCFKTVFGTFPSTFKMKKNSEMPVSWLKNKLLEEIVK